MHARSLFPAMLAALLLLGCEKKIDAIPQGETSSEVLRIDYEGFTVWLDCDRRGAVKFRYNAQHDTGDHERHSAFYLDPKVPSRCQQKSASSYRHETERYDRGHLTPANHLDHSAAAIRQSNYMTNILPQAADMNRGAWLLTEEIVECYRDIDELLVIGGVIWGDDESDDYFLDSHGVATPDAFWKVVIRGASGNERAIAWLIPNAQDAKRGNLDEHLIGIATLEEMTGERFRVPDWLKEEVPETSWLIPAGCNKG